MANSTSVLTWGDFKHAVEAQGVEDGNRLHLIDFVVQDVLGPYPLVERIPNGVVVRGGYEEDLDAAPEVEATRRPQ